MTETNKKALTIRIPEKEINLLKKYCKKHSRSQTEVLREFIRTLSTQK